MKPPVWLILVSFTANLLLAGWGWQRSASPAGSPTAVAARGSAPALRALREPRDPKERAVLRTATVAAPTTWADIQSNDLKLFIRRLRTCGCPEATIQDLILAEVNRLYAVRTRALWPERYEQKPFWQTQKQQFDPVEQKRNRESYRQERAWQKEKSALLVELLGVDPEKELRKEQGLDDPMDWQTSQYSFLPEAKREALQKYLDTFDDQAQEMYARNRGMWDAQSRAEQRALEAEKLAGLAQILTPSELREYELRSSQTANQLGADLHNLTVNREQYEAIFDIRKKYGETIYNWADNETAEGRQLAEANQKAMKAELAAALGPDLVKQMDRSQDYYYQQLVRMAERSDLPADTAGKIYDYKQAAEDSAKLLRENKTLTSEQRQEMAQQIRSETEATLVQTLGEKNYKRYLRNGGWWLNTLAPPPPRRVTQ